MFGTLSLARWLCSDESFLSSIERLRGVETLSSMHSIEALILIFRPRCLEENFVSNFLKCMCLFNLFIENCKRQKTFHFLCPNEEKLMLF